MSETAIKQTELKTLKENGFLQQVQPDRFSLRVKVTGGQLTAEKLLAVSGIAKRYGSGTVHLTSRQAVEVPHIKYSDIEAVRSQLKLNGLEPGILGARVRTITACQGAGVCKHGKIKTSELAAKLGEATANIEVPHKFKIGITGCCNNCLKAEENDLGIKGGVEPQWSEKGCNYCGGCAKTCPAGAINVDKQAGTLNFFREKCINCGRCVRLCPAHAWQGVPGYILYFGGTFGNRILTGQRGWPMVMSAKEVVGLVLRALEFYQANGKQGERFGFMLERLGTEKFRQVLAD